MFIFVVFQKVWILSESERLPISFVNIVCTVHVLGLLVSDFSTKNKANAANKHDKIHKQSQSSPRKEKKHTTSTESTCFLKFDLGLTKIDFSTKNKCRIACAKTNLNYSIEREFISNSLSIKNQHRNTNTIC